jgi:outer membrane protein TolC
MRQNFLIIVAIVLLAGCHPDQAKERAFYRSQIELPTPTTQMSALTLRQALLLANQNDESLSISGESYLRRLIDQRRAVASFLPTISLSPQLTLRQRVDTSDTSSNNSQTHTFDVPVRGSIGIFNGFSDLNRYWSSTFAIEQDRQNLLDTQQGLLLDVATVFYQVLRAEASVRVIEASLVTQEERLRDIQGRLNAGMARPLDVAQTQAQVASTRVTLVNAQRDVATSRAMLSFLTQSDISTLPLSDTYEVPADLETNDIYLQLAQANRNDLSAALNAVKAARAEVDAAFGQYYPSVSLDVSAFIYRESLPDARNWDALLALNLPLFSAGLIEADVREAWSFYRQALLVEQRLRRQIAQDIDTSLIEIFASEKRLAELKVQVDAAQQAYDQSDQSYRAGLATNLDRVTAQATLLRAQLDFSNEYYDRKLRQLQLLRTAGMLRQGVEQMQ